MKKGSLLFILSALFFTVSGVEANHTLEMIFKVMGPDYHDNM
jgi:hypothetical protein